MFDEETGLYYLRSRYYNADWCRFLNADAIFAGNLYGYCNNSVITCYDPNGYIAENNTITDSITNTFIFEYEISSSNTVIGTFRIDPNLGKKIYDVPLYCQGDYLLCWAFCQVMVEDFHSGTVRSQEDAKKRAIEIAIAEHGEKDWNQGGHPNNVSDFWASETKKSQACMVFI